MRRQMRVTSVVMGIAGICLLVGCHNDPLGRQAIDGSVTLDGVPLTHGNIRFEPTTPGVATAAGAVIADGEFYIGREQGLPVGVYRVSISCPGEIVKTNPQDEGGLAEELVPARYNQATELEVTVTGDGENSFPFDLVTDVAGEASR